MMRKAYRDFHLARMREDNQPFGHWLAYRRRVAKSRVQLSASYPTAKRFAA
jgi:hypothetical protein